MSHWLVHTAVPLAEHAAIFTLTSGLVTTLILVPFRSWLKKFWRAVDSLDPKTDSGVTKMLGEIEARQNVH